MSGGVSPACALIIRPVYPVTRIELPSQFAELKIATAPGRHILRIMTTGPIDSSHWTDPLRGLWMRLAADGWVPARWYLPKLPDAGPRPTEGQPLKVEIVSHCWNYTPFLIQQLNSIINFPPGNLELTVTVYHAESDTETVRVLEEYTDKAPGNVTWNWRSLPEPSLFRRAIGRNEAAKNTKADWIWFTDCDVLFREGCLDSLGTVLPGRTDPLVFPRREWVTPLLSSDHPMINPASVRPFGPDVDAGLFEEVPRTRATGPLQIMHGDMARGCGYCDCLSYYQKPVQRWAKAYEDRAIRWLLRTQGEPVEIPGVYRIRHQAKGR